MRKLTVLAIVLVLLASACASNNHERTVLVDYSHDQFASFMGRIFPKELTVAAGDTVVFKQIWTGEPHTITGGSLVNTMMKKAKPLNAMIDNFSYLASKIPSMPNPDEDLKVKVSTAFDLIEKSHFEPQRSGFLDNWQALADQNFGFPSRAKLGATEFGAVNDIIDRRFGQIFEVKGGGSIPSATDDNAKTLTFTQNAGERCFLNAGLPPKDPTKPCTKSEQRQPLFNGKQSFYNSGIIPYEGPQGNTFRVKLADTIKPGSYFFFCTVHGPAQYTELKVKPKGTAVPSQEVVSRQAQREITEFAAPMLQAYRDGRDGTVSMGPRTLRGPFAGLSTPVEGSINEFFPKTVRTSVGKTVTWKVMGSQHTITFDVPKYFPIIRFAKDGTVSMNPKLSTPAGGSPKIPEGKQGEILKVDGGTYNGTGFYSSGLLGGEPYAEYSLRFSKPGTYKFACLLHPPMVGTVEVR